jgi:hypothetical protein
MKISKRKKNRKDTNIPMIPSLPMQHIFRPHPFAACLAPDRRAGSKRAGTPKRQPAGKGR